MYLYKNQYKRVPQMQFETVIHQCKNDEAVYQATKSCYYLISCSYVLYHKLSNDLIFKILENNKISEICDTG